MKRKILHTLLVPLTALGLAAACSTETKPVISDTEKTATKMNAATSSNANNTSATANSATANEFAALDAELAAIVNDGDKPLASLSVLAVRQGKVVYQQQFGYRFIDQAQAQNNKRADASTLYRVASISKLVTTLGVMRLVEEGKLDLDRDIGEYLGYTFRNPHFPNDKITTRMLLSHTSSLRDDGGYYWESKFAIKDALLPGGSKYGAGAMWAKNAKPGAYFQYANLPWGVVATVMERITGERFDLLMRRLVFDPLGLAGGFNPAAFSNAELANTATLYRKRSEVLGVEVWKKDGPWVPQVDDYSAKPPVPRAGQDYAIGSNGTAFGPQGGARLSAQGLGTIMLMLMNKGVHDGKPFLKPQSVEAMFAQVWLHDEKSNNGSNGESGFGSHKKLMNSWGLGVQRFIDITGSGEGDRLVAAGGFKAVGHLGDAWGLTSAIVLDPVSKNGMVFLIGGPGFNPETNNGKYSSLYRHEEQILDALYRRAVTVAVK
jgi:CubicO group peptidase (beta-lactamase class C family)